MRLRESIEIGRIFQQERDSHADENKKLQVQIASLGVAAQEALELKEKVDGMQGELKELKSENKSLTENYNSERVSAAELLKNIFFELFWGGEGER